MIAKQSVFVNLERDAAFPEGHEKANLLLVRQGQEITEAELEKYAGASDLADTEAEVKEQPVIPPPNLKKHGEEDDGSGKIPDPKIKNAPDAKEEGKPSAPAAQKVATPPVKVKRPVKGKRGRK